MDAAQDVLGTCPATIVLNEKEVNDSYGLFAKCDIDVYQITKTEFVNIVPDTLGREPTVEETKCVDSVLTEDNMKTILTRSFQGIIDNEDIILELEVCFSNVSPTA